ncbi:hypothetical protein ACIP10_35095 [Streptomyces galbus]|uniref:hypothetical protein n=1 Tax=Streptomyces galbus TaxID=33898 RepID=UPI00382AAA33
MTDYLAAVLEMLGPAQNRHADPAAWDRLHAELGIQLPPDYRALVDAFAPIQINGHLYLSHPAAERWNLGHNIRSTIKAWFELQWDDLDADEDPRELFGLDELSFGDHGTLDRRNITWSQTRHSPGSTDLGRSSGGPWAP